MERGYAYEEQRDEEPETDLASIIQGQIDHCLAEISLFDGSGGDSIITVHLERMDPSVRSKFIELTSLEIEAFRSLDPETASETDVHAIASFFTDQRNNLTHKQDQ